MTRKFSHRPAFKNLHPPEPAPDSRVCDLHPESHGVNLVLQVVEIKVLLERRRPDGSMIAVAEALVGDATGCVLLTAKNEQIGLLQTGATLALLNARIVMFQSRMRLVVDAWGHCEPSALTIDGAVDVTRNISDDEYQLVSSLLLQAPTDVSIVDA